MSETSYKLTDQFKYYGLEYLIPDRINIDVYDDTEPKIYTTDPSEDGYYDEYDYHDKELNGMKSDDICADNAHEYSIARDLEELMQIFNSDFMEPGEFLSMNVWDFFGISKKQFDMIKCQQISADDFCSFYDAFVDDKRKLPVEKRIKYSIAEAATNYRAVRIFGGEEYTADQMLSYVEHIIDTHSFEESRTLLNLLMDYYRFYNDALEMNERRRQNGEPVFAYTRQPKPTHIHDLHDKAFRDHAVMESERACEDREALNRRIGDVSRDPDYRRYLYKDDKYIIRPVVSQDDLDLESAHLRHCVNTYGVRMADQSSYIYLIRKAGDEDTPFYTAEILPPQTPKARPTLNQLYTFDDTTDKTDEFREFVHAWIKKYNILVKCTI